MRALLGDSVGDAGVRIALAEALEDAGEADQAEAVLSDGLAAAPTLALWIARFDVRLWRQDLSGARQDLAEAKSTSPDSHLVLHRQARLDWLEGRQSEAYATLKPLEPEGPQKRAIEQDFVNWELDINGIGGRFPGLLPVLRPGTNGFDYLLIARRRLHDLFGMDFGGLAGRMAPHYRTFCREAIEAVARAANA